MTFLDVQIISKVGKYTASINRKTTFSMYQTQLVQRCERFIKKMQLNSSRSFHLIPVTHSDPMAGGKIPKIFTNFEISLLSHMQNC